MLNVVAQKTSAMDKILAIVFALVKVSNANIDEVDVVNVGFDSEHVVYRGFPVGILCSPPVIYLFGPPDTTPYTTCIIQKNGVIIFNRTTDPVSIRQMGIFEEADDSWHMAAVNVTLITDNVTKTVFKESNIKLEEPPKFDCNHQSPFGDHRPKIATAGESISLKCHHYVSGISYPIKMHIPEYLKPNYTVRWYKGCQRIERDDPEYEYTDEEYAFNELSGTELSSLKVKNASFTSSVAEYSCVLENSNLVDRTLYLSTTPLCVKRKFQHLNNPSIKMSQKLYTVEPGSDLEVQATGNLAAIPGSLSLVVTWTHITINGPEELCSNNIGMDESSKCKEKIHENKRYCEPVTQDEIQNIFMQRLDDNFTATLFIPDAGKEDEGTYVVTIMTPKGQVNDTFTLRLDNIRAEPYRWTIALIVAGVLVVIALVLLTILNKKRTDVRYIVKKICGNYQITNRPMAFLIYSRDVGNDMPGVLDTVTQFFGGRRYYDANNVAGAIEANQAGMLVHEHVVLMMGQSLSVMIFVTENLLAGNDMENFEVYQGLEENIRQALPLIFICTRAIRRRVLDGEFDDVNNALRTFMLHQKSKVIIWNENDISCFRRGLYVALPKVPHIGVEGETQVSLSKSAI